jgi:hypothetical protein
MVRLPIDLVYLTVTESRATWHNSFLGHLRMIFDIRKGIDCMERLSDEFGDIVRVKGILGVCPNFIAVSQIGRQFRTGRCPLDF